MGARVVVVVELVAVVVVVVESFINGKGMLHAAMLGINVPGTNSIIIMPLGNGGGAPGLIMLVALFLYSTLNL